MAAAAAAQDSAGENLISEQQLPTCQMGESLVTVGLRLRVARPGR
jgi:hypothetical protein